MIIREPQTCCFDFNWLKNVDEMKWNEMHEIEFIIKNNEFLIENKIKKEVEQLLLKYNHGNDIYEHVKQ